MTRQITACVLALSLLGCATHRDPRDTCDKRPAQSFIGSVASQEMGEKLMILTKSRQIRWTPPGMIVTTGYSFGQLTVGYDLEMKITSIECG